MATLKTQPTSASVKTFIDAVASEQLKEDTRQVLKMMERATKTKAKMWGGSIIGCGERTLSYANGSKAPWMRIGLSPRQDKFTLYLAPFDRKAALLAKLGKYKGSKACVHIKRLADVDATILEKLIAESVK